MNIKLLSIASVIVIVSLLGVCIYIAVYYNKREKRILNRIQKMIDDSIEGTFQDYYLDESKISAVENSMWRYLCDNQVYISALLNEREQIQKLISDISHQTVTPLANIMLYSQLLEECDSIQKSRQASESMDEIAIIREQVKKVDFLIDCLSNLSRLEHGIIKVNPKNQKVASVLSAVQDQFIPIADMKGINFSVEFTDEMAVFDLKWTIEAVANVVDNAIKYTPSGGRISICVEPYSFFTCIKVTDNGLGIPETEQANVFTRFYRCADVSEKPGLGIGLYLTREVLKAQNGYIKLTSKIGKGSVFSLYLIKD